MSKKSNGSNYGLTVGYSGVDTIEGTLVSHDKNGVFFMTKKSGSSTTLNQYYPDSQIIACYGTKGGEAVLVYKTDRVPVFRSGKRGKEKPLEVTGLEQENNLIVTASDDFPVVIVHKNYATFSGEEKDESAPKRGRKAASDKPKAEKKAKAEKKPKGKAPKGADWS